MEPSTESGIDVGDDDGRSPAAEEDQDHQAGQCRRDDALADDAAHGAFDEYRLIADLRDLEIAGQRILDLGQFLLEAVDDRQRRHRSVFQDLHQHRAAALDVYDIGLRRIAIAHVADVVNIDYRAIHAFDRQIAKFLDCGRRIVELDGVLEFADLLGADWRCQVLGGERVCDILAGKATGLHRPVVEVDLYLTQFAAERQRDRGARDRDQRRAQRVQSNIGERLLRQA